MDLTRRLIDLREATATYAEALDALVPQLTRELDWEAGPWAADGVSPDQPWYWPSVAVAVEDLRAAVTGELMALDRAIGAMAKCLSRKARWHRPCSTDWSSSVPDSAG